MTCFSEILCPQIKEIKIYKKFYSKRVFSNLFTDFQTWFSGFTLKRRTKGWVLMKRISEFNDEDCAFVFSSLDVARKRVCLINVFGEDLMVNVKNNQKVYLFKDVIHLIVRYGSIQTWARLRQVCQSFNRFLSPPAGQHPDIEKVRSLFHIIPHFQNQQLLNFAEPHVQFDEWVVMWRTLIPTLKRLFVPHLIRLLKFLEQNRLDGGGRFKHDNLALFSFDEVSMWNSRNGIARRWFKIDHLTHVEYPTGAICKSDGTKQVRGFIFQEDLSTCFDFQTSGTYVRYNSDMTKVEKMRSKTYTSLLSTLTPH